MGWSLEKVSYSYGSDKVLHDISTSLQPGLWHGVLGPNGSGKSTLLDILSNIKSPESGTIAFAGKKIPAWRRKEFASMVAMVPQEFRVNFSFTVREIVAMGRNPHLSRFAALSKEDWVLVDAALADMNILALAERTINELSGGEKQRVSVAMALAQDTGFLVLDEATANLDIYHSLSILETIRQRVSQGGLTVVSAVHDLNLAARFCDNLLMLNQGRLEADGSCGEVLQPETINRVYGVEVRVNSDDFIGALQVNYRLPSDK